MELSAQRLFGKKSDLAVVIITVAILAILFTPMPAPALDFLLVCNVSLSLLILMLTFYSDKPLSFSTFPSILLITTLFRLALNISATRLILDEAEAGKVIEAVGSYVVGGNYAVGVVVFIILIVVQYVVVTNGAQRVAEVAARFTLDSMPGKQMSIDADLNMGIITEEEAKNRRQEIQQEANFYGAMDGATKFVKGDAIAGIIIIFVDIVAGLMLGVGHHGLSWGEALSTYTLLTVGDGIVTQIPSLVIATATGIIITRAATDSKLGNEVVSQITAHPSALLVVTVALFLALFIPGLPKLAIGIAFIIAALLAFYSYSQAPDDADEDAENSIEGGAEVSESHRDEIYKKLSVNTIEVRFSRTLGDVITKNKEQLYDRIKNFRQQFALESGLVIPSIKIWSDDSDTELNQYGIFIHGARVGYGEIRADAFLAIGNLTGKLALEGEKTREPTYGLPAIWVSEKQGALARNAGYTVVDWQTMLLTHLSECIRKQADQLLTRRELEGLLERNKATCESLVAEIVPNQLSLTNIQKILQKLLHEQVPIRNVELILEVLADESTKTKNENELVEKVRKRLGSHICQPLLNKEGELEVLTLDPGVERTLLQQVNGPDRAVPFNIDPANLEKLMHAVLNSAQSMMSKNCPPIVLCAPTVRPGLKQITERVFPKLVVLAVNEIPTSISVKSFSIVKTTFDNKMLEKSHG